MARKSKTKTPAAEEQDDLSILLGLDPHLIDDMLEDMFEESMTHHCRECAAPFDRAEAKEAEHAGHCSPECFEANADTELTRAVAVFPLFMRYVSLSRGGDATEKDTEDARAYLAAAVRLGKNYLREDDAVGRGMPELHKALQTEVAAAQLSQQEATKKVLAQ